MRSAWIRSRSSRPTCRATRSTGRDPGMPSGSTTSRLAADEVRRVRADRRGGHPRSRRFLSIAVSSRRARRSCAGYRGTTARSTAAASSRPRSATRPGFRRWSRRMARSDPAFFTARSGNIHEQPLADILNSADADRLPDGSGRPARPDLSKVRLHVEPRAPRSAAP